MEVLFVRKTFIIGLVWTAIIVGIVSFGATVLFLEADARKSKKELVEQENKEIEMIYETDQTAIRTNQLASLEGEKETANFSNQQGEKETQNFPNQQAEERNSFPQKTSQQEVVEENQKEQTERREESEEDAVESMNSTGKSFIRPVKGDVLRPFSPNELIYSNTLQEWNIHKGTDYKAKIGEEVVAIRDGAIKEVSNNDLYGEYIIIDHGEGLESLYANITVLDALKPGNTVKQGQLIGYVAESFGFEVAEETHLHFELKNSTEYLSL